MKLTALLCIHLCSTTGAEKGSSRDKFWRRQQQHRGRRTPAPTRAPTTTAAPVAAPDRRGAVRARARVLAQRAAAAPLPVLSATKCVVALLVVSETALMAVVDRRLQQTAAVRDGRAAVIFVADRHDHALNKKRLDTTRLRYVENADMAAVAGTDVSEYATEAPRLREIADCGDIRIRSQRCAQMMPRKYWRDLVTAAFWVALRSAPRAEYVLRVEPDAMLCLDSLVTALAAVPASAKPFVLGLRRYCHYDDTFSLVSRPLADAVVFEWPHLRDFARLTTKYTMYGMVWPALVHWLRRVRGFEAELLASNPDLKTLIQSEKLERYVQIIDPIDHHSGRNPRTSAAMYKKTYEREAQAGFAKKGVRFDEETREWILYYTDRFGRNVTLKKFPPNRRFARLEALRAAQPRTAPAERCLARWYLHQYKAAADMDAHWPEFTSMDGRRPAADWAPYWDAARRFPLGGCFDARFHGKPGVGAYLNASAMGFPLKVGTTRRFPDTAATSAKGALEAFEETVD